MAAVGIIALSVWLIAILLLASYAVHLGLTNRLELQKLALAKPQMIPLPADPEQEKALEKINRILAGEDEFDVEDAVYGKSQFKHGPI